jgi:type III secretory pathway component EscU
VLTLEYSIKRDESCIGKYHGLKNITSLRSLAEILTKAQSRLTSLNLRSGHALQAAK